MKKILAFCLSLVILLSCIACAKTDKNTVENNSNASSSVGGTVTDNNSSDTSDNNDIIDNSQSDETETPSTPDNNTSEQSPNSPNSETPDVDVEQETIPDKDDDSQKEPEVDDPQENENPTVPEKPDTGDDGCAHYYSAATCKAPQTCTKCGATKGSIGTHKYSLASCTSPEKCKTCGKERGEAMGHKFESGECTRIRNGKVCGHRDPSYCPKLYFTGDMSTITDPKQQNKNIECNINFEYKGVGQNFDGAAKIKIQGSSSTRYAKKNYTINFYKDSSYSSKQGIDVGWGAQSKYCLKANWIDKTHSRNVVTAKLVGEMQEKYGLFTSAPNNGAIDGFPVEIYINGEFHGLYTMNIPKDEWMFNMDKNNPNHIVICGDNWNDPVKFKAIPTDLKDWAVEVGPEDDATLQKVQRLVDFVLNSSDAEFKANFSQYLNLDATLNYYVMMTYAWMPDNTGKNMLLATYDGKVWYPSLYDLDTTWGAHWTGTSLYNYHNSLMSGGDNVLWQRMEKLFKKEIAARYFELREDILDPTYVMDMFKGFYNSIPEYALSKETQKWNTAETPLPGYDLSQIQGYLNSVIPRLDAKYQSWR